MINVVAHQIIGKRKYTKTTYSLPIQEHVVTLIREYKLHTDLRRITTERQYTTISEEYALSSYRINAILDDSYLSALLTDKCVELLLMNSLQEIL